MRDVESHNDEYSVLVPEGRGLMKEYQPDDWLGGIMQALHDRWFGFIDTQVDRWALNRNQPPPPLEILMLCLTSSSSSPGAASYLL